MDDLKSGKIRHTSTEWQRANDAKYLRQKYKISRKQANISKGQPTALTQFVKENIARRNSRASFLIKAGVIGAVATVGATKIMDAHTVNDNSPRTIISGKEIAFSSKEDKDNDYSLEVSK